MDCSTPEFPVYHQFPECTQTPLIQWCHPTISSSIIPISSCLQSFPTSGSFPVSQFFSSGGQSTGASASASVLPMNVQDWFPLGWTDWISLQSKGFSRVFSNTTVQKHQFFDAQLSLWSSSHIHTRLLEEHSFYYRTSVSKVMSLLFNMLSGLVTAFLPRTKHLLISWLQSPSAVILKPRKIKSVTASTVSPSIRHEVMQPDAMIFVFWMLSFKPTFSLSSFTFKRLFSSFSLLNYFFAYLTFSQENCCNIILACWKFWRDSIWISDSY